MAPGEPGGWPNGGLGEQSFDLEVGLKKVADDRGGAGSGDDGGEKEEKE